MIQLYIDSQPVEITQSVGLYLNKTFESLDNPTKYHTDFSKTITLPMTPANKKVFDNYNRQDSVVTTQTIDPRKKIPFYLLYNGNLVMDGNVRLLNADTMYEDNKFEVELYSAFGMIMNEIEQLTFNGYEVQSNGGDKDDKYLIESPFGIVNIDRNIIRESFEQEGHDLDGESFYDYVKFVPSYQGQYEEFESDKIQYIPFQLDELDKEHDEHYMREFRSYYQEPALWVDKLWKMVKDKVEEITDYEMVLDSSWFNSNNPYYTDLIYTCPSLFTKDDNFVEYSSDFNQNATEYVQQISAMHSLSVHHEKRLWFHPEDVMYRSGVMNPDLLGYSRFTANIYLLLHVACSDTLDMTESWMRIRDANPMFVDVTARRSSDDSVITSYRYKIYSGHTDHINYSYDEGVDVGITCNTEPNCTHFPAGQSRYEGFWFEAPLNISLDILENTSYYITLDARFANNGKAVEYALAQGIAQWDWLWTDYFFTGSNHYNTRGYKIYGYMTNAHCTTVDFLRTRSKLDMYRIFPKKTKLIDVILNYSRMFGLIWDVDQDNRKVTVMTRNKYFSDYTITDWSRKLDRKRSFKLEPLCFDKRYVNFNFDEGKGMRYENYENKFNVGYGSKKIDTGYQFNADTDDFFKGLKPSMVCQKSQSSRIYNTSNPEEPNFMGYNFKVYPNEHYIENDDEGNNAENSGAFYFVNGTFEPDGRLGYQGVGGYATVLITDDTQYMKNHDEYAWNLTLSETVQCSKLPDVSTIDKSGKYSIHFESPKEYYFRTNVEETDYVYNLFWRDFIDERYSVQNKKLTAYFYMSPDDYKSVTFKDFIKIDNTLYHINKIFDYDFDTNSPTKVELVQVWDINAYTHGQLSWPYLFARPEIVDVTASQVSDVRVYANVDWTIMGKPSWIDIERQGDILKLRATSTPLQGRGGFLWLVSEGIDEPIVEMVKVRQESLMNTLVINPVSGTVPAEGGSVSVRMFSVPYTVSVLSKPWWVSVQEVPLMQVMQANTSLISSIQSPEVRSEVISGTLTPLYNCRFEITAHNNPFASQRHGQITFTNGMVTRTFSLTQLGGTLIAEEYTDDILQVDIGHQGVFSTTLTSEIDVNSVKILGNGAVLTPSAKAGKVNIGFKPKLDIVDHGDGTPEEVSGGQILVYTADGRSIVKNYNYGPSKQTFTVSIKAGQEGLIEVDSVQYESFYEDVEEDTVLDVTAVSKEGYAFVKWSDGDTNDSKSITVSSRIELTAIFEKSDEVEYDNSDLADYDNNTNILYDVTG